MTDYIRVNHGDSSLWHSTTKVHALLFVEFVDVCFSEECKEDIAVVYRWRAPSQDLTDYEHLFAVEKRDSYDIDNIDEGVTVNRRHGNPIFFCDQSLIMFDVLCECLSDQRL